MSDTSTMPIISKTIAKDFAVRIYEQIPAFCETHRDEYIAFLKSRNTENARKELERLKIQRVKPIVFFACPKVVIREEWLEQVAIHEQYCLDAYIERLGVFSGGEA